MKKRPLEYNTKAPSFCDLVGSYEYKKVTGVDYWTFLGIAPFTAQKHPKLAIFAIFAILMNS